MASRRNRPASSPTNLTARMAGISMNFAATPQRDADLESTLAEASQVGMDDGDLRVLAVLTTWLGVHHAGVDGERLALLVRGECSVRVRAYWAAIASWLVQEPRLVALRSLYRGRRRVDLLIVGNDFQVKRRGEDARFVGSKLRVPDGTLRDRGGDVLPPDSLARRHTGYRQRLLSARSAALPRRCD